MPKPLPPFASRMQVAILQGASKPSRTLGSLQVLAWLPPPSGQVNHRGTTGQGRGGSQSRRRPPAPGVVQHAFDLVKYSITVPWSQPPLRRYTSMDRTLETRWRKFQSKSLSTLYGSTRDSPSSSCTSSNFPGLFELLTTRLQEAEKYESQYETTRHAKQPAAVPWTFPRVAEILGFDIGYEDAIGDNSLDSVPTGCTLTISDDSAALADWIGPTPPPAAGPLRRRRQHSSGRLD
ncbi:hypothetical protein HPB51_008461 [Rhipicephalus microplus]|uniref:Uncharacterized protein n=1 Tax=Rhipicephalus microplus TaxID=6941 RepID=A0A9J6ES93_RHIMP|nr:hypothetical protein HPB51_008461 [Rhipicephalus microplus]